MPLRDRRTARRQVIRSPYSIKRHPVIRTQKAFITDVEHRRYKEYTEIPSIPESLQTLLQRGAAKSILDSLKMPILYFYCELLKKHYTISKGDRSILMLINYISIAMQTRIAAVAIQRFYRFAAKEKKENAATMIQCCYRCSNARYLLKTEKAIRFLRRLQMQGLLRCFHFWSNETKLAKYHRNKLGEKGKVFDAWWQFSNEIKTFKLKVLKRKKMTVCKPIIKAIWMYVCKAKSVRLFVYKVITGKKRQRFNSIQVFAKINSRARRIQNWFRCCMAKWLLFLLRLQKFSKRMSSSIIALAGKHATCSIRERSAVAIQSIVRGHLDRSWAVEYRVQRCAEFEAKRKSWNQLMYTAGIKAIFQEIHAMNKDIVSGDMWESIQDQFLAQRPNRKRHTPTIVSMESPKVSNNRMFSTEAGFSSIDVMDVKSIPTSATSLLFRKLGKHISKEEAEMTSRLLSDVDGQVRLDNVRGFIDAGVVYSANDTSYPKVSLPGVMIRGAHLKVMKMLRTTAGIEKRQRIDRERLANAQIEAQMRVWSEHATGFIHCSKCMEPFCFASKLVFKHLSLRPRYVANKFLHGNSQKIMNLRGDYRCKLKGGPDDSTRRNFLRKLYGNDLIFLCVDEVGRRLPWAHHRLHVGGLLD